MQVRKKKKNYETVNRVERVVVNMCDDNASECLRLCTLARNMYNENLRLAKEHYKNTKKYLDFMKSYKIVTETKNEHYYAFNSTRLAKAVMLKLEKNYLSFFELLKLKKAGEYKKKVRPPSYLKDDKLFVVEYNLEAVSKPLLLEGKVALAASNIEIPCTIKPETIKQIRIVPKQNHFVIEIVYEKKVVAPLPNNGIVAMMDMGVQNLVTVACNQATPCCFSGRAFKSLILHYDYLVREERKRLPKGVKTSKRIKSLLKVRNQKIKNLLHTISRGVVNYLQTNHVTRFAIGKNNGWKQKLKLGRKMNKIFGGMGHAVLIDMILYKAADVGIIGTCTEESYTSKCSFLDGESLEKHPKYVGKRKGRMFVTASGQRINADVNGALNIGKKIFGNYSYDPIKVCRTLKVLKLSDLTKVRSSQPIQERVGADFFEDLRERKLQEKLARKAEKHINKFE